MLVLCMWEDPLDFERCGAKMLNTTPQNLLQDFEKAMRADHLQRIVLQSILPENAEAWIKMVHGRRKRVDPRFEPQMAQL